MNAIANEESYQFKKSILVTELPVELWMCEIENEMHHTLKMIAKESIFNYAKIKRIKWFEQSLGMISIIGGQIWWTWQVEDAFNNIELYNQKYAMKNLSKQLNNQLNEILIKIRDININKILRKKLSTMIIIDVHARDIVDNFVRDSITNKNEFDWESQLRFYWDKDIDDIIIKQCATGIFNYGYEYQGLNGRLVITPLTDRSVILL